jgi:predicted PurR-regulated permease PerM
MTEPGWVPPPQGVAPKIRARILFGFLAAFLVLLIVFRGVLFPFLMAIYLAYLIEPAVGWLSRRRLGVEVGRAPALIVAYAVIIAGIYLLGFYAVRKLGTAAAKAANDLERELSQAAPAALVTLDREAPADVWIPRGTRLRLDGAGAAVEFRTLFPAQISEGATEVRVLLERAETPPPSGAPPPPPAKGLPLVVVDPSELALPAGASLGARTDDAAQGLELFWERWLIAPVSALAERVTGQHLDPGLVRKAVTDESRRRGNAVAADFGSTTTRFVKALALSLYQVVLVLMIAAFIVVDRVRIAAFFESLPPAEMRPGYRRLMEYVDKGLAGVIRGQVLICLVNGFLTWLGLELLDVPYAVLLGLIAGIFSLIPVFGTIASSIPIVLVALATGGVHQGVVALAWICLIHLLEANLLNPLIMGSHAGMHPVVIVFALLAGEHAFGVWGALLAVPTASIIQSCFQYYRHEIEGIPPKTPSGHGTWLRRLLARKGTRVAVASPRAEGGP